MKTLCIGAGGIGSWLIHELIECIKQDLIPPTYSFAIADYDIVEIEQMKYQNFQLEEAGMLKTQALKMRYSEYGLMNLPKITSVKQLKPYDLIIVCADNNQVRQMVFNYCHQHSKEFIDLRAEGRMIMAMVKSTDRQSDIDTLDLDDKTSGSCQTQSDLKRGWVQKGNKIVALCGCQMYLNLIRGENNQKKIIMKV